MVKSHVMVEQGTLRIWIDDPNPIFRCGVAACIDHCRVVGESSGLQPLPTIELLDVLIFAGTQLALSQAMRLRRRSPACGLTAIVDEYQEQLLLDAIDAGVGSILLRSTLEPRTLVAAVNAVAGGATTLTTELVPRLLRQAEMGRAHRTAGLSEREMTVLRHVSSGLETREIADTMGYSERTVKNLVHDMLTKMNCRNRAHAVAQATRIGLI